MSRVPIHGLVRSQASAQRLYNRGCHVVVADLGTPGELPPLPTHDCNLIYLAPPPPEGTNDPWLARFLDGITPDQFPNKIVLLSTTAVYGDCQGRWINEAEAVQPQTDRGQRRLSAEQTLSEWCRSRAIPYVILRVAGIYGPGRWPLERLRQGLPALVEAQSPYTNRIHQDDLARICIAAMSRGRNGEVYNVADGRPGTMTSYFKAVARAFHLPPPPEVSIDQAHRVMTAGMLSYLTESRRIDNHKLLEDLQITLRYPDLEAGLAGAEP